MVPTAGSGKSTLVAALGLFELMLGGEGATVVVVAVDERQAGIVFGAAVRMVELHTDLASRVVVYKDKLVVPSRGASFQCLPASPAGLEGLDYTLALADEIGRINRESWEVLALAQGKRERSTLIGIGTPGPTEDTVLASLRAHWIASPDDLSQVYVEHSAAGFEDHPPDCEHCWTLANPALDDFLHRDAMRALLPPKMTEAMFRRARLCQHVTGNADPFVDPEVWDAIGTGCGIPDRSEVVIALDGSFGGSHADTTALLVGTVDGAPHFDTLAVWESDGRPDWRVDVLAVEDEIRAACERWNVRELVCDPFRWTRTMQVLAGEGITVAEFPHSPSRLTAATTDLYNAIVNARMSHSGDKTLTRHVMAATVVESDKGLKLSKVSRERSAAKIDLAACLVMAHSRCTWLAMNRKTKRYASFAA